MLVSVWIAKRQNWTLSQNFFLKKLPTLLHMLVDGIPPSIPMLPLYSLIHMDIHGQELSLYFFNLYWCSPSLVYFLLYFFEFPCFLSNIYLKSTTAFFVTVLIYHDLLPLSIYLFLSKFIFCFSLSLLFMLIISCFLFYLYWLILLSLFLFL